MKSEIKEKGNKTEEGRLIIKEIRKGEFGVGMLNIINVFMGLCGIAFSAEGIYALNQFLQGYRTKYNTLFDVVVGVTPFILAYLSFANIKNLEKDKQKYKEEINELENDILKM